MPQANMMSWLRYQRSSNLIQCQRSDRQKFTIVCQPHHRNRIDLEQTIGNIVMDK